MTNVSSTAKRISRTQSLVMIAVFAALTGVLSWISVPLPFTPIPINLALVGTLLAASVLSRMERPYGGAISMIIYMLLGAIGIPVFHNGTSGLAILIGPTGGFIIGYVFAALFAGYFATRKTYWATALANMGAILCCYAFGLVWYIALTGSSLMAGITACMLPFLPGDVIKSLFVAWLSRLLARRMPN